MAAKDSLVEVKRAIQVLLEAVDRSAQQFREEGEDYTVLRQELFIILRETAELLKR